MKDSDQRGWRLPAVVALAVLVHLPGLFAGFYIDDYLHQLVLGGDGPMSPWSLYDFGSFDDWDGRMDASVGSWPFWTSPDWNVRFLRPLASASLVLDHALFGSWAPGYALSGLVVFAALLLVVQRTFRSLGLSSGSALLALAFFGVSGSTVIPVEWAANRNSLLEVLFVCAAVWAAAEGRPALGLVAALLAVASKESGVVAFVLVPAALALRDPARAKRWLPVGLALAAAYVGLLFALGFGTNSAFYVTPWSEPARYATKLAVLAGVAVPSLVGPFPLDLAGLTPALAAPFAVVGAVLAVPVVAATVRYGRDERAPRLRGFLVLWVLLGLATQGAAPLNARLLIVPAVPAAALVAQVAASAWSARTRTGRVVAALAVLFAGPMAAFGSVVNGSGLAYFAREIRTTTLGADVGDPELGHRSVWVLQSLNTLVPFAITNTWAFESADHDLRFHVFQNGRRGLRWSRPDERTMVFESLDEPFLSTPFERVYMVPADVERLRVGRAWRGLDFSVEATAGGAEGITELTLTFDRPPGPAARFLVADGPALVHAEPPPVGGSRVLAAPVPEIPFMP